MTKAHSFTRTKTRETNEIAINGADEHIDIAKARKTGNALETDSIALDVTNDVDAKTLAYERFLAEEIEVILDEGGDDAPGFAEVTVNGVRRLVTSERWTKIPRSHAFALAQAKQIRVVQERTDKDADGFQGFVNKAKLKLANPFRWKDDNPRSNAMLNDMVASRA